MFRQFVAASGLTNLADGIATVVWAWVASLLTRDPLYVALVPVALRMPWFLFALPAGIVTDRVDRRLLILWMDVVRAAAFTTAVVILWVGMPLPAPVEEGMGAPIIYLGLLASALCVGAAEVFRDNAAQTMLPAIVRHDELERANGRLWSVEMVGNSLVGPALGAFLVAWAVPLPFAFNALAYCVAIFLVLRIAGPFKPASSGPRNWRGELREGVGFLRSAPLLRLLALLTGGWNLFFMMMSIALVLHVQENLGLGAQAYGLILAAGAVGGIAGGFLGERIVRQLGPGQTAQVMLAASPIAFFAVAFAPNAVALGIIFAMFEFTGVVWNTVSVSYRQRAIPDRLLGRVNSVYRLLAWGMMPVGLLASGLIVRIAEGYLDRAEALTAPFLVAAAGSALLVVLGWRGLGRGFR